MAIIAKLNNIDVEVTGVFEAGGRKRVTVKALQGKPFTVQTHGGPATTDTTTTSPDTLSNVHSDRPRRKSYLMGDPIDPRYAGLNEYAGLFPSRYSPARAASTSRGGMNND